MSCAEYIQGAEEERRHITLHLQKHKSTLPQKPPPANPSTAIPTLFSTFHQIQKLVFSLHLSNGLTKFRWFSDLWVPQANRSQHVPIPRQCTAHVFTHLWQAAKCQAHPRQNSSRSLSARASPAGLIFSYRKEIVNTLAFVLDKCSGRHFAMARNSRPLLISLRLYWCATQSQNTISLLSLALFSFNAIPSSNLRSQACPSTNRSEE